MWKDIFHTKLIDLIGKRYSRFFAPPAAALPLRARNASHSCPKLPRGWLALSSLLLEEKVAEAAQRGAKTDEVDTCANPERDLKQIITAL